jgi:glycosyltransferase involved in cell wall biosynthesis
MSLTVGICAFNEERNIAKLLRDVLDQTGLPPDTRIIVVASGCTDNTPAIVREIMRDDPRVELVEEETRTGKISAVNLILSKCRSDLLALVDADVRLHRDCLMKILREFSRGSTGVVGASPIVVNVENGEIARSAAIIWRVMKDVMSELSTKGQLAFIMGETYCFRTSIVGRIPDKIVNDDAYVASRAWSKGFKVILASGANFSLKVPSSIPDFIAQRRRVTFGHLQIKEQTGRFATSMEGIALYHTRTFVRGIFREIALNPMSLLRTLLALELEAVSRLLAWLDLKMGRPQSVWKRAETTK